MEALLRGIQETTVLVGDHERALAHHTWLGVDLKQLQASRKIIQVFVNNLRISNIFYYL